MAEWSWVALGFGVAYGGLGAYLGALSWRRRRAQRRLEGRS